MRVKLWPLSRRPSKFVALFASFIDVSWRFIHIYETVQHRWLPLQQALHSHELKLKRLQLEDFTILPDVSSLQIGKSEERSGGGKKASQKNMDIETDLKDAGEILHAEAVFAHAMDPPGSPPQLPQA